MKHIDLVSGIALTGTSSRLKALTVVQNNKHKFERNLHTKSPIIINI